nr:MAG: hypothetical protein [Microvirus sp.]
MGTGSPLKSLQRRLSAFRMNPGEVLGGGWVPLLIQEQT